MNRVRLSGQERRGRQKGWGLPDCVLHLQRYGNDVHMNVDVCRRVLACHTIRNVQL